MKPHVVVGATVVVVGAMVVAVFVTAVVGAVVVVVPHESMAAILQACWRLLFQPSSSHCPLLAAFFTTQFWTACGCGLDEYQLV